MTTIAMLNIAKVPRNSLFVFLSAGNYKSVRTRMMFDDRPAAAIPICIETIFLGGKAATMRYSVKKHVPLKMPKRNTRKKHDQ